MVGILIARCFAQPQHSKQGSTLMLRENPLSFEQLL